MHLKTLVWTIVLFVSPVSTMAQDNKEMLLLDMYSKSGLEKQIEQMPMIIMAGFDQAVVRDDRMKAMPPRVIGEIRAPIETLFAADKIKKTILAECREKLSVDDLKKIMEWLDSPLGRKFTQLEVIASTPEKYVEIQQFAGTLQKSPRLPEQLNIIRRLDAAVKATETGVEVAVNTQMGVAIAMVETLPKEQQPTYDDLFAAIEKSRPQFESVIRAQTIVSLLYTYRNVPHEELDRYIAFASSPTGTGYHDAVISGMKKALLKGSYKWGELIADILKQSTQKTDA